MLVLSLRHFQVARFYWKARKHAAKAAGSIGISTLAHDRRKWRRESLLRTPRATSARYHRSTAIHRLQNRNDLGHAWLHFSGLGMLWFIQNRRRKWFRRTEKITVTYIVPPRLPCFASPFPTSPIPPLPTSTPPPAYRVWNRRLYTRLIMVQPSARWGVRHVIPIYFE